jgi:hypothetical protein
VLPVLPVLGPLEWSPYRLRASEALTVCAWSPYRLRASVQGSAGLYTCVAVGHLLPPVHLRSHDTLGGRCIANGECLDVRAGEEVRKRREVIETGTEGHVMIGYKLVEVVFPYLGLQQRAEALIKDSQMSMYSQPFSSPSCAPWPCAPLAAVSAQEDAGQRKRCTPPGPRQCRAIANQAELAAAPTLPDALQSHLSAGTCNSRGMWTKRRRLPWPSVLRIAGY